MSVKVFIIPNTFFDELKKSLENNGFSSLIPTNHAVFMMSKEGMNCTLFRSGKLVIQGKYVKDFVFQDFGDKVGSMLMEQMTHTIGKPRIGSDESGKGDILGPLCVAAVFLPEQAEIQLYSKVKDSKVMTDRAIIKMAIEIKTTCPNEIVILPPSTYNKLYAKFANLNHLLAWAHSKAIMELAKRSDAKKVVIDKFADSKLVDNFLKLPYDIEIEQRIRAESDTAVACASILARNAFLSWLDVNSKALGIKIAKGSGATAISSSEKLVSTHGKEILFEVAKMHFKSIDRFFCS